MTRPAITFDTGALIALERRKERAMKVFAHARDMGFVVATPNATVAEWCYAGSFLRCACSRSEVPTVRIKFA